MNIVSTVTFKPLFRVKHDAELPTGLRDCAKEGCPEVFPLNGERTPFGSDWQHLTFELNPLMTGDHWRVLYEYDTAFMNGTGFNQPGSPRADFVNGRDLGAPLPAWDKTRVCGGATISGSVSGTDLTIEILDGTGPAPTLKWLLARPWLYFTATTVRADGTIGNFPQNNGYQVLVPLVGSGVAKIPLSNLVRVGEIADPYRI